MKRDPTRNYEALEALVTAFGAREAARQTGMNPSTVKVLAWRKGWHHVNPPASKPGRKWKPDQGTRVQGSGDSETLVATSQIKNGSLDVQSNIKPKTDSTSQPICNLTPGKALERALSQLKSESQFNLATYSARASAEALQSPKLLEVSRKAKDIADIHKTIWPAESDQKQILNIGFIITGR